MSIKNNPPLFLSSWFVFLAVFLTVFGSSNFFDSFFLLAGLVVLTLAFFKPFLALGTLILIRPLLDQFSEKNLFSNLLSFPFSPTHFWAVIAVFTSLVLVTKNSEKIFNKNFFKNPLLFLWFIFLSWSILSLSWSINKKTSLLEIARIFSFFSFWLNSYLLIKDKKHLSYLVNLIICSAFIPLIKGWWQFFTQTGFQLSFEDVPNRTFGTFAHPNPFAYFLVFSVSLLMVTFKRKFWQNNFEFFKIILLILFLGAIFLTYTRGAWITLFLTSCLFFFFYYRKILWFILIGIAGLYLVFPPLKTRIDNLFVSSSSNSVNWRIGMWLDHLELIEKKLFQGTGIGTSTLALLKKRGPMAGSLDSHNDFLKIALEGGIFLLIIYWLIWSFLLFKVWQKWQKLKQLNQQKNYQSKLTLIFFCSSLALLIASFFDNIWQATALNWAFWSLAGAIQKQF